MNTKNIAITALIAIVVAIGVVMVLGQGSITTIVKEVPLGGVTNYDEIGSNNVATGKVSLLYSPSATGFNTNTGHRMGWSNKTGQDVIVSNVMLRRIGTATSSMKVSSATSSSKTATSPLSDFGQYKPSFSAASSLLFNNFIVATGTGATTTISSVNAKVDGYSTSTMDAVLVRAGEAIQFVVSPTFVGSGKDGCIGGTSYNLGVSNLQNCELATSTNYAASLQFQFDYTYRDPNQSEP